MINRCNILLDFTEAHFFLLFEMLPTKKYSLGFYRYFASELTQNLATNQTDIYLYNSYESKTLVWLYLISTEPGSPCHQHDLTSLLFKALFTQNLTIHSPKMESLEYFNRILMIPFHTWHRKFPPKPLNILISIKILY